ncbi:MAG TPA: hypothetical protein VFU32_02465 [Ktedonobacterales bacterium]|nr:hypothetical protein [Ktedonobacterales bacterium]
MRSAAVPAAIVCQLDGCAKRSPVCWRGATHESCRLMKISSRHQYRGEL